MSLVSSFKAFASMHLLKAQKLRESCTSSLVVVLLVATTMPLFLKAQSENKSFCYNLPSRLHSCYLFAPVCCYYLSLVCCFLIDIKLLLC